MRATSSVATIAALSRRAYGSRLLGIIIMQIAWRPKCSPHVSVSLRKRSVTIALTFLAFTSTALANDLLLNPDVTQATISTTICQAGWTRTVRPYVADMKRIKAEMLSAIGEPIQRRNQYELDI